jgi:hypothetical protein
VAYSGSTSVATDSEGSVYVAFLTRDYDQERNLASDSLRYATNEEGIWAVHIVDDENEVGDRDCVAIALDSDGYVHISYTRVDVYRLTSHTTNEPNPGALNESFTNALLYTAMIAIAVGSAILCVTLAGYLKRRAEDRRKHRTGKDRPPPSNLWKD